MEKSCKKCAQRVIPRPSLFHIKITASVTKSLHQDRGLCYLHLPIFFLYIHSPLLLEKLSHIAYSIHHVS